VNISFSLAEIAVPTKHLMQKPGWNAMDIMAKTNIPPVQRFALCYFPTVSPSEPLVPCQIVVLGIDSQENSPISAKV
jgi:hypothetical protein